MTNIQSSNMYLSSIVTMTRKLRMTPSPEATLAILQMMANRRKARAIG
jgi:hypothetical protein